MNSGRGLLPVLPPLTNGSDPINIDYKTFFENPDKLSELVDQLFDQIMELSQVNTTVYAIQTLLAPLYNTKKVTLWHYLESHQSFFSQTYKVVEKLEKSILKESFTDKKLVYVPYEKKNQLKFTQNEKISSEQDNVLIIPMVPRSGTVGALVEIAIDHHRVLNTEHYKIAQMLMHKFKSYYHYLITEDPLNNEAIQLLVSTTLPETYKRISSLLAKYYSAKVVEFWMLRTRDFSVVKVVDDSENPINVEQGMEGIAGAALERFCVINERYMKTNKNYNPNVDGNGDQAILCVPCQLDEARRWAIVLRGRVSPPHYSRCDEHTLLALTPFACKSISAAILPPSELPQFDDFESRFQALLEIAMTLSGQLDIDNLIPMIMSRACSLLNAQRCSLFLIDKNTNMLTTRFANGVEKGLQIPITQGIVGQSATTGAILNIPDAYADPRFNKQIDIETGFRTNTILSVPILNNRGEIIGVTEMINKKAGLLFDDEDIRMMNAFNVFCGISLDNAKLYQASLDLSRQLTIFTEMSSAIKEDASDQTLKSIVMNAKNTIGASGAVLYIYNSDDRSFQIKEQVGKGATYGTTFAEKAVQDREDKIFSPEDIDDLLFPTQGGASKLGQEDSDDSFDSISSRPITPTKGSTGSNRVSMLLSSATASQLPEINIRETIVAIPLLNNESSILGVFQLSCPWQVIPEDVKMLKSYAVFASLIIERHNLKGIAEYGQDEVEMNTWMTAEEKKSMTQIPAKLVIPEDVLKDNVFTIKFNSLEWDGIGHFKVLFAIFHYFDFFQIYNITNEKFFRFLYAIRSMYKKVPYHNWRHAVDVTQFVTYQIMISGLEKVFSKFELFSLVVAAICHDANHDGFTNIYNIKAETPLGILYKNQSVMETHHCSIAIQIMSREECNLLAALKQDEYIEIWSLIIQYILATDMARHFEILKRFNDIYDGGDFTMQRHDHRVMLLYMILKCGDISNVSRPFELADRWCDVLCEEFFRQGDLEQAQGMAYTSDLNDRSHLDKPKSQIGFYTYVTLPMFQAAGKAVPALDVNMRQVLSNLSVWKRKHAEALELQKQAMANAQDKAATPAASATTTATPAQTTTNDKPAEKKNDEQPTKLGAEKKEAEKPADGEKKDDDNGILLDENGDPIVNVKMSIKSLLRESVDHIRDLPEHLKKKQ